MKKDKKTIQTSEGMISVEDVEKGKYRLFAIDEKAIKKYNAWLKKQPKINLGAAGGETEFVFIPTGLGTIILARYNGKEIDLTDFDNW